MWKRSFDFAVSGLALLLLCPVMAVIAFLVWLDSGRPIFYGQERVGKAFRLFRIRKFRSMRIGQSGPQITAGGDRRITRIGAALRAAKLDELPQFWNVLVGDMSLVGPRPEVPKYVELHREQYARVLTVRPGITDNASLVYRQEERLLGEAADPERYYREAVLPEKLRLSLQYIERQSFAGDVWILIRTFAAVFGFAGSDEQSAKRAGETPCQPQI